MALLNRRKRARHSRTTTRPTDTRPPNWWRKVLPDPIRTTKVQALQTLVSVIASSDEFNDMTVMDHTDREYPTVEIFMVSGPHYRIPIDATGRVVEVRERPGCWWFAEVGGLGIDLIDQPRAVLESVRNSMRWNWTPPGSPSLLEELTDAPDDDDDDDYDDVPPTIIGQPSTRSTQQPYQPFQRLI